MRTEEESDMDEAKTAVAVKLVLIALTVVSIGLAWLTAQFHVVVSGNYGHDVGFLETSTLVIAMLMSFVGSACALSLVRHALGISWPGILIPTYVISIAVVLTVTNSW